MLPVLRDLGVTMPVLAAPMAGGPTTADLVTAASRVGSMGFIAGGYRTPADLAEQVREVRDRTDRFGVNLFAPNPVPVDPAAYRRYRDQVRRDADRLGAPVPEEPVEDDDRWHEKVDLLVADPVPVVSFTFAIPDRSVLHALRAAGAYLVQTVTSADEAAQAAEAGVDAVAVQASDAGGHSATLTPSIIPPGRPLAELVAEVRVRVGLPIMAAGGLDSAAGVADAILAGADATVVGTALLLTPEAGTSGTHRAALTGPDRGPTIVTRAFTGRPARALRNAFLDAHHEDAPAGYPALHHLTSPMRKAAAAAGDPEYINLWAGSRYRSSRARPAGAVLEDLAAQL